MKIYCANAVQTTFNLAGGWSQTSSSCPCSWASLHHTSSTAVTCHANKHATINTHAIKSKQYDIQPYNTIAGAACVDAQLHFPLTGTQTELMTRSLRFSRLMCGITPIHLPAKERALPMMWNILVSLHCNSIQLNQLHTSTTSKPRSLMVANRELWQNT